MCGKSVSQREDELRSRYGRHMGRPLRILEPDGIYNVGSRGNNKETMFRDATDWMEFLRLLAKASVRFRWEGWAYCLMGNHFHLLVQLPHLGLSEGMQLLNAGYAVRTNARYKALGPSRMPPPPREKRRKRGAPARALSLRRAQSRPGRTLPITSRLALEQLSRDGWTRAAAPLPRN